MSNPLDKHKGFLLDTLLPTVINHAAAVGVPPEEAAMAAFLTLGTVLQSKGIGDADLMAAIKASKFGVHAEPEILQ